MLFLNILLKKIQISHHASDLFCRRRGRILPRIQSKNHQIWTKIVFLAIFLPNHVPTYFKVRAAGYGLTIMHAVHRCNFEIDYEDPEVLDGGRYKKTL